MKPFEFERPAGLSSARARLAELSGVVRSLGNRVLVVCGGRVDRAQAAIDLLRQAGCDAHTFSIPGEPEVGWIEKGAAIARKAGCDVVVGFGGGSALDAAKAIAALATNARPVFDYLEVIGKGQALEIPALPIVTVPTTAGTGAEVTRNAVLSSKEHRVKASLRSAHMLPRVAIVDPELTYNLPSGLTASTGMDALTQVIEPFVCSRTNPMVDALCREAIPRIARGLPRAFKNAHDIEARRDMSLSSLFGTSFGKRRSRRGARFCRPDRGHVSGSARSCMRGVTAGSNAHEYGGRPGRWALGNRVALRSSRTNVNGVAGCSRHRWC